jgi:hypothetical protein
MEEVVTKAEFDAFKAQTTDLILRAYENSDGGMEPTLLFKDKDGKGQSVFIPNEMMINDLTEAILAQAIKRMIKDKGLTMSCFCTEAWALQLDKDEPRPDHKPSEDSRSIEIILMMFEAKGFRHTTQFKVEREVPGDPESKVLAIHPFIDKDLTEVSFNGALTGFFEDSCPGPLDALKDILS